MESDAQNGADVEAKVIGLMLVTPVQVRDTRGPEKCLEIHAADTAEVLSGLLSELLPANGVTKEAEERVESPYTLNLRLLSLLEVKVSIASIVHLVPGTVKPTCCCV